MRGRLPLLLLVLFIAPVAAYQKSFDNRPEATEKRLQGPARCVVDGAPQNATAASEPQIEPGQKVYQRYCSVCHAQGIAGAPKTGDLKAWQKRMAQGWPVVMKHALQGYKGMPAKGHCMKCTEQDIRESIEYMLKESGFEERSDEITI